MSEKMKGLRMKVISNKKREVALFLQINKTGGGRAEKGGHGSVTAGTDQEEEIFR